MLMRTPWVWALPGVILLAMASAVVAQPEAGFEPLQPAEEVTGDAEPDDDQPTLSILDLLWRGGALMWPIGALMFVVITFGIERAISLRSGRILPEALVRELGGLGGRFDPREAFQLCQKHPSPAADVVQTMLLKTGRPLFEIEKAVEGAVDRAAQKMYDNVRWLTLAAAVAPLIGLLGTVWGMIQSFFMLSVMEQGANRTEVLSSGIYAALATTLAGLSVAIPAAALAHFYESRIQALTHDIEDLVFNLLPQVERYEGKVRFSRPGEGESRPETSRPTPTPPPAPETSAAN